jgi:hypothetical protein
MLFDLWVNSRNYRHILILRTTGVLPLGFRTLLRLEMLGCVLYCHYTDRDLRTMSCTVSRA